MATIVSANSSTSDRTNPERNANQDDSLPRAECTDTVKALSMREQHSTQTGITEMMDNTVGEWLW
ncbi:MAG: hypothetical protein CUN55_05090 [Phototrophicales bacterium]|nr:MAG: hypothetical protein CUN55_05090 [Phototrophicales bacterium]